MKNLIIVLGLVLTPAAAWAEMNNAASPGQAWQPFQGVGPSQYVAKPQQLAQAECGAIPSYADRNACLLGFDDMPTGGGTAAQRGFLPMGSPPYPIDNRVNRVDRIR